MMPIIIYHFLFIAVLLTNNSIRAQQSGLLQWCVPVILPAVDSLSVNPGVAGAFSGVHNNVLIIAGGANFPYGMPWQGGKKVYHDKIYILSKNNKRNFEWYTGKSYKLKHPVAYGAAVSSPRGIICIGGEDNNGITASVFLMSWDPGKKIISQEELPSLPFPLTNLSAVMKDGKVYVAGGETTGAVSGNFLYLDINDIAAGWKLLPALPKALSHAAMVVNPGKNAKKIFLVGGRKRTDNGISELYESVYAFDLETNKWYQKQSLPYALSAGTGIVISNGDILLFGGDKGETFHKTEQLIAAIAKEKNEVKKQELIEEKSNIQTSHPGFSNEVLYYDTKKDTWIIAGRIPFPAAVTTTAVKWRNQVFIPSGEIKAGVRTPQVLMGTIKRK